MVFQRRLEYGFSGYQVPVVPRASRSARGRGAIRKKRPETQIHAFEILANVAGKLLQESKCSAPPSAACEKYQHNLLNYTLNWGKESEDTCRQENYNVKSFAAVPEFQGHHQSYELNEFWHTEDNLSFKFSSSSKTVDQSAKNCFTEKLDNINCKSACAGSSSRVVGDSSCYVEFFEGNEEGVIESRLEAELSKKRSISRNAFFKGCSEDRMEMDRNPSAPINSGSDLKVSLSRDCISPGPFPRISANIKVVRDDDENSVGCIQSGTIVKAYRPSLNIGDGRIQKLSALKHWRVAPNVKNGCRVRADGKTKPVYRDRRTYCAHHRSQRIFPFKKRRFYYQSPSSAPGEGCNCEGIFDSPDKRTNGDNHGAAAFGASSVVAGQQVHPESSDCNVKFSIKSFKVPELFVEIPATETVGSLKRTVMDAVTAILGDGLHVGILLQGKKVRDDSKTLLQSGISQDDKRRTLGFMLEPGHTQITPSLHTKDPLLSGGTPTAFFKHSASLMLQPGTSSIAPGSPVMNLGSCIESDRDAVPSLADTSEDNTMPESRALVTVPEISMEALAVVPFYRQPGHPEYVPRRIRRPFSVSEVEALVQAVEQLGTGRWRDVKLLAFDSAKHRTYVDLKDKWKTLVHTARISPQQRRGEPVPQELLDRVLAAHAFWSHQQVKHKLKPSV